MATTKKAVTFTASQAIMGINQVVDLLVNTGQEITWLVQGDMGSGKTSILKMLEARLKLPGVYFDCTTKDLGDLFLPDIYREAGLGKAVRFVPNEEFGIHLNRPFILMLDELGKNRGIINGLLRVMQERHVGSAMLPPGSIVFATTNLGAENVGDMLAPHARNRIGIVRMKKPNAEEWMNWGMENSIEVVLMAAVHEFPQMLQSFTDVEDFKENPYIYDPRDSSRTAFVTPRSLEKLSHLLKKREFLGDDIITQGAIGLVGAKAAMDIMTMVNLGDTLPKYDQIVKFPDSTKIPAQVGAQIMSCLTCMQRVEEAEFKNVFTYVKRLPMEIQALFCNQLLRASSKAGWVARQSSFTEFAQKNYQLFAQ